MIDYAKALRLLVESEVRFILIGGVAAIAHGAARLTQDIDFLYSRDASNLERLAAALAPLDPYPRGAPPGLPFVWDTQSLSNGSNFTLTTTLGDMDLLAEISGGGTYDNLLSHSVPIEAFGVRFQCLDLAQLIKSKRAAGRPKDFEAIAELELLLADQPD